ncbi:MAG: UDP-N-acetylglucosamine 1-carboxyvinyltransferase [Candidatus Dojkabacteria bacterium]
MSTYIINGGNKISGTVTPMPNKNSILPLICSAVLFDEPVTFHNVPKSTSVRVVTNIFKALGGKVSYHRDGSLTLDGSTVDKYQIPDDLAEKERSSLMFLGGLLAKLGKAELGKSGGCKLGSRPVDTLINGLTELGAQIDPENIYKLEAKELKGNPKIWQFETSVTGTENLIIAAVKAKGTTVIYNAACEPHVQDLCNFLNSIGAKISGIGSNKLTIEGVEKLTKGEWTVISDHIDIGGLIVAAAITGGELRIKNAIPSHMQQILEYYERVNLKVKIEGEDIIVPANQKLICQTRMKGDVERIRAQPWPTGFPADLMPQMLVLCMVAEGNMYLMNAMYENQLYFVEDLQKMKGNVILSNPHVAFTYGPSPKLKGAVVSAPAVLQSAHAVALAAFAARGETRILNADIIKRRFPEFVEVMRSLGGDIREE